MTLYVMFPWKIEVLDESSYSADSDVTNEALSFGVDMSDMETQVLSDNEKPIYPKFQMQE